MTAASKKRTLDTIIEEIEQADSAAEVSRLEEEGYRFAVGSNRRKRELREAAEARRAELG